MDGSTVYFSVDGTIYLALTNTLVAGVFHNSASGDGGPATSAFFESLGAIAVDPQGNVYVVDSYESIRKIALDGTITHVAGNGTTNETGDGGPAVNAGISMVHGLSVDTSGNLYLGEYLSIRKIDTMGVISSAIGMEAGIQLGPIALAPSGAFYFQPRNGGVFSIQPGETRFDEKLVLAEYGSALVWALDATGALYWIDGGGQLNKLAAGASTPVSLPLARLLGVSAVAVDGSGDAFNCPRLRPVRGDISRGDLPTESHDITLPYGDGPAGKVDLGSPSSLASDASGNLYFADQFNGNVRELTAGCPVVNQPLIGGVVSAASYDSDYLAAGELATTFGQNFGPAEGVGVPVLAMLFLRSTPASRSL